MGGSELMDPKGLEAATMRAPRVEQTQTPDAGQLRSDALDPAKQLRHNTFRTSLNQHANAKRVA